MSRAFRALVALSLVVGGCGSPAGPPAGTGAREAAEAYFGAIVRKDWPATHATLTVEARARVTAEHLGRLGREYHRHVGFDAHAVQVNTCSEHGGEAVAHVTLSDGHGRRYKDAVTLRREGAAWGVVLPANFGQPGKKG